MVQIYSKSIYPSFPCPTPLFTELIRVNDLRRRQAIFSQVGGHSIISEFPGDSPGHQQREETNHEADALLSRIVEFQVMPWAKKSDASRGRLDTWIGIGSMYKSAMIIFATLSLSMSSDEAAQGGPPSATRLTEAQRTSILEENVWSLNAAIERAVNETGILRMPLCWPTIALGVAAAHEGSEAYRETVSRCLLRMAVEHGTALPFKANEILGQFWATGKVSWNECFDRPYAFFT